MRRVVVALVVGAATVLVGATGPVRAQPAPTTGLSIFPNPQSVRSLGAPIAIPARLQVVGGADPGTLAVIRSAFSRSGARTLASPGGARSTTLTVVVGRNPPLEQSLGVATARGLPPGGYVLATERTPSGATVVLDGADPDGTFDAAQTFSQLIRGQTSLPAVAIRDWPALKWRGVVEGFYGKPWTLQQRLSALDFMAAQKMNFYSYAPKDDLSLRSAWRRPVSRAALRSASTLAARAQRDHVVLDYGISPGDSICYSSAADRRRIISKLNVLWSAGIHAFSLLFDDIDPNRALCAADARLYGTGEDALPTAQADLVDYLDKSFAGDHPLAFPLVFVPTQYSGVVETPYRAVIAKQLDPDVVVQWTGAYGVSTSISAAEAAAARAQYNHPLLLWDNFYVNDYSPGNVILGPFVGAAPGLRASALGILADPMVQPEASKIGLFTLADYAWNDRGYDPQGSWQAAIAQLAGSPALAQALTTFAGLDLASPLGPNPAPALTVALASFWTAWNSGSLTAAPTLQAQIAQIAGSTSLLANSLVGTELGAELAPWLDATSMWCSASTAALGQLVAQRSGDLVAAGTDTAAAQSFRTSAMSIVVPGTAAPVAVQVAGGLFAVFVHAALRGYGP